MLACACACVRECVYVCVCVGVCVESSLVDEVFKGVELVPEVFPFQNFNEKKLNILRVSLVDCL